MYKSLVFGDEFLAQGLHLKMITITIIIHLITEDQVLMFYFTLHIINPDKLQHAGKGLL